MEDDERLVKIRDLKPGDMVDLQGDPYADPNHEAIELEYELMSVYEVVEETPGCFLVTCNNFDFGCGFPPDHKVLVVGHDTDCDEVQL